MPTSSDPIELLLAALTCITLPPPNLEALAERLRLDPCSLTLVDLGLDSLGRLEACIALEIDHGVLITPEAMAVLHSADELLQQILSAPRV